MTTKKKIEVQYIVCTTVEIEQSVIDVALTQEWRETFYNFQTENEVAQHIV